MLPSAFRLSRKTHLHPMMFFPGGHRTMVQVPVCSSEPISRSIASFQQGQSERDYASCMDFGSPSTSRMVAAMISSYPARLAHSDGSGSSSAYPTSLSPAVPSPASILLTSVEGFRSLVDCQVGCTGCASGHAGPLPLHFFGATCPTLSLSSLSSTLTSSSLLEVAGGGSMAGFCSANCCGTARAISVGAGGACAGAGGAASASACPTLPSGGAEVYTVVKSVVNLTSRSMVMPHIEGQ